MDRRHLHPALQDLYTEKSHAFQRVHKNASVFFAVKEDSIFDFWSTFLTESPAIGNLP